MKKFTVLACLALVFVFANAIASDFDYNGRKYQVVDSRYPGIITGKSVDFAKSQADTFYIYGGPDSDDGKFETVQGEPEPFNEPGPWWYSQDLTLKTEAIWHVDTMYASNLDGNFDPNHAWWCGECNSEWNCGDNCGYGNNYNEQIDFSAPVANPALSTTVTVNAVLNYDMESCCDFLYLQYSDQLGIQNLVTFIGDSLGHVVNETFVLTPDDYIGDDGDEILVRWRFKSDSGWSDEDCSYGSDGAAQVDNIEILFNQGSGDVVVSFENNEGAENDWTVTFPPGVGDFAKIWPLLANIDPCRTNNSPLMGFIDDGEVEPGTGGYQGTSWLYGPNGYIVNPEGGLAGPDEHLNNEVWSPILDWPGDNYVTAAYEYDVYHHEDLDAVSPGMFYVWHVRSTAGGDILLAPWADRNFVYYSPNGTWGRTNRFSDFNDGGVISDLMVAGRTQVQLALGAYELGWVWGYVGTDGTPAPYFDNVAFLTWEATGPGMGTREIDIANDNFPDIGTIDYDDLAANSIRFDMARDVSLGTEAINYPGDSIIVDAVPLRTGSVLNDLPRMYYKLFPNPLFDGVRTSGLPNEGIVIGDSARSNENFQPVPDRYEFDLPDEGFFFPGDVINYYFEGQDNLGGDIGTTIMPGDTAGFSGPPQWPAYDSRFRVQGLPTLHSATEDDHPKVLFWNDFGDRGGENEWYYALYNLGNQPGVDFDVYYTNGPSSGVGSGLGGRATSSTIQGYDILLYTCGNLGSMTISNGDFANDPSNDAVLLDTWLQQGDKNMFLTGDDLLYDMAINGGPRTEAFVANWIGVSFNDRDLRPLIDNQATPIVQPIPGNSLNLTLDNWIAYGGCIGFNRFDAVQVAGDTEKVAEFLDPNGSSGQYQYAAMTYFHDQDFNVQTVYTPYDLMFVYSNGSDPGGNEPIAARTRLLDDVLLFFGHQGQSQTTSVPDAEVFTVRNYPNPFNPSTKIEFFMPQRGELRIKIFNVRGELVRTLVNEVRDQGADFVIWDGSDDRGSAVASGVYFYETRAMGETSVNKMALVK